MTETSPRNLWPVGIVSAFALFFAGTIALIVIACSHRMDLVSPDYYEQEIRYQTRLEQANRALELGSQAAISYNQEGQVINILLPTTHAANPATGDVLLYRPSAAHLDRHLPLKLDPTGIQRVDAAGLQPGLWKVRVSWSVRQQQYFIDRSIIVAQK